jgi:hypothetical protein
MHCPPPLVSFDLVLFINVPPIPAPIPWLRKPQQLLDLPLILTIQASLYVSFLSILITMVQECTADIAGRTPRTLFPMPVRKKGPTAKQFFEIDAAGLATAVRNDRDRRIMGNR